MNLARVRGTVVATRRADKVDGANWLLVEECDQLCRILGKSIAAAKAGRRQMPGDGLGTGLPITDDKFSMTNSQLKGPKS